MRKNVLYIKSVDHTWLDVSETLREQHGWDPVLWVGTMNIPEFENNDLLKGAIFYEHPDARRAIPPKNIPNLELPAIDAKLLEKLSKHENEIFEMMSRFLLNKDHFSYDDRKHLYYNLLRVWTAIIRKLNVDIVIIGSVPHRVYDYVIYLLCQEMGITYLMIEQTSMAHLSYSVSSITDRSRALREKFHKIPEDFTLSPATLECLKKVQGDYENAMPLAFKEKVEKKQREPLVRRHYNKLPAIFQTAISIAKNTLANRLSDKTGLMYFKSSHLNASDTPDYATMWRSVRQRRKVNIRVNNAKRWYRENSVKPDLSKPYIYFSAHFQPERSTCPDAGAYHDMHLMVDILSKAVPEGWKIYYKEHPSNFRSPYRMDNIRDIRFYERIRKLSNCVFVDHKMSAFDLIDNSIATASASGSCAWEGIIRGIPAIIFGDWWYSSCPGVIKVDGLEECKAALKGIQAGFKPDLKEIKKYLAAAELCCEDLHWRRTNYACISDVKRDDPAEYNRRNLVLSKVLGDEYYRLHPEEIVKETGHQGKDKALQASHVDQSL